MKYRYARVSTKEQNTDRQIAVMKKESLEMKKIYIDKSSGKDFNRREYKKFSET